MVRRMHLGRWDMFSFSAAALAVAIILGGLWGWHVGTKRLRRRPIFVHDDNNADPLRDRRRRLQRYWLTMLYAALAATVVMATTTMLKR